MLVYLLDSIHSCGFGVGSHYSFDLHFGNEILVSHLYIFFEKYLFKLFVHFWIILIFFSVLGNLYIFWMLTPLSHKWFANISPHFVCYLFTQLIVFWYTEHFSFHEVLFVCFYVCYLCLSYHLQEITVKSVLWNFCPMFSSKGCIVWGFTFRSLIHLKLISYMVLGKCLISFFSMWMFSFPSNICWKYCPFCIEMSWHLCQTSFDHICEGSFSGLFILLLWSICLSLCQYQGIDYCSFVVFFKSANVIPPALFFFFRVVLASQGAWVSIWISG